MRSRILLPAALLLVAFPAASQAAGWLAPVQVSETGIDTSGVSVVAAGTGELAFVIHGPSPRLTRASRCGSGRPMARSAPSRSSATRRPRPARASSGPGPTARSSPHGTKPARRSAWPSPGSPTFATLTSYPLPSGETVVGIAPPVVLPSGEELIAFATYNAGNVRVRALGVGPAAGGATAIDGTAGAGAIDLVAPPPITGNVLLTLGRPVADDGGRVYVPYWAQSTAFTPSTMDSQFARIAIRPAGGSFGAAQTLGAQTSLTLGSGIGVGVPAVAAGPGVVTAGWGETNGMGVQQMRFKDLTGGTLAAATSDVATVGFPGTARLAVNSSGATIAVWAEKNSASAPPLHVRGLVRLPGGAFPPPSVIADPGAFVELGDIAVGPEPARRW